MASLQAQDYQISFAGTGTSTNVSSIKVENLTQGKSITLSGTETLHLVTTITGANPIIEGSNYTLRIYPNPMFDNSTIDFIASSSGKAKIELFDITGQIVCSAQNVLAIGQHSYQINGLKSGIFFVRVTSPSYTYTGKLLCSSSSNSETKIVYIGNSEISYDAKKLKNVSAEKFMQYTTGDRLKFTGISGSFCTIVTDVPTQSKILTFNFVDCTDGAGNHYPVVQIGTQCWMAENLRTTQYNDNTVIPLVVDGLGINVVGWTNLHTPGYCWFNNDELTYKNSCGALYNWHTVNTGKLAPNGWHVPSDSEWTTLSTYLSDKSVAGGKLKEIGTTRWQFPNTGATNETGFSALPSGTRDYGGGNFNVMGFNCTWWSKTENELNSCCALNWSVSYFSNAIWRGNDGKGYGFSVRCIKD